LRSGDKAVKFWKIISSFSDFLRIMLLGSSKSQFWKPRANVIYQLVAEFPLILNLVKLQIIPCLGNLL
jgi:hypothetical protein